MLGTVGGLCESSNSVQSSSHIDIAMCMSGCMRYFFRRSREALLNLWILLSFYWSPLQKELIRSVNRVVV